MSVEVYLKAEKSDRREMRPPEWFTERIRAWQTALGLEHWKINAKLRPRMKAREADVKTYPTLLEADITFRQDILIARGDSVVVHELLHVLTDDWAKAVEDLIKMMVPKTLQEEAQRRVLAREELAIEALAHAFIRTRGGDHAVAEATPVLAALRAEQDPGARSHD